MQNELTIATWRLTLAMFIAVIADLASVVLGSVGEIMPLLEIALDLGVAAMLFSTLGFRRILLLPLVCEAIPGVAVFPFWTVATVAVCAGLRSKINWRNP